MGDYGSFQADLLVELNRNLNTRSMGDICENIVKFPAHFQNNPFPMIISPCVLKLSEIFKNETNYMRILILQVMMESEHHLDKVLNFDIFVQNILKVGDANDPLALSLLLKMLGVISRVVPNNKNLHFLIKKSMDSIDPIELDSAIEASIKFAVQSQEFAENIYPKVVTMLENPKFPIETKIKLLDVINNITHNYNISQDARQKLSKFLELYPSESFVCAGLHTLTQLAVASVIQIPIQVKLLLEYSNNFPRIQVKLAALKNLKLLVHKNAHHLDKAGYPQLFEVIVSSSSEKHFPKVLFEMNSTEMQLFNRRLEVVATLLRSQTAYMISNEMSQVFETILQTTVDFALKVIRHLSINGFDSNNISPQLQLASICFVILTNVSENCEKMYIEKDLFEKTCLCFESFFLMKLKFQLVECDKSKYRTIFLCLIRFLKMKHINDIQICRLFQPLRFVFNEYPSKHDFWFEMLCETLCTLGLHISKKNSGFSPEDVLTILTCKNEFQSNFIKMNSSTLIKLFVIWFQLKMNTESSDEEINVLLEALNTVNLWTCYKIAREAMRFSNHTFANRLLEKIQFCMETIENSAFWMNGLKLISSGECLLVFDKQNSSSWSYDSQLELRYDQQLVKSILNYTRAVSHLKASEAYGSSMKFQNEFVRLRLKFLQIHRHFRQCCRLVQTSPPPFYSETTKLCDDMSRLGRITPAMEKCSQDFRCLSEEYGNLFQNSFNADHHSLAIVHLLQHSCTILAEIIEMVFNKRDSTDTVFLHPNFMGSAIATTVTEHMPLRNLCSEISTMVDNGQIGSFKAGRDASNEEFLKCLADQVHLMMRISTKLLSVSLPFPRFFFQPVQSLSLKVEISSKSQRNTHQEFISNLSSQFVLNVEGVVVDNNNQKYRPQTLLNLKQAATQAMSEGNSFNLASLCILPPQSIESQSGSSSVRQVNKVFLHCHVYFMRDHHTFEGTVITLQSVVDPLNDYFRTQFMIPFKTAGLYHISVEASIIDDNDAQWKTGSTKQAYVRISEEKSIMMVG